MSSLETRISRLEVTLKARQEEVKYSKAELVQEIQRRLELGLFSSRDKLRAEALALINR